MRRLRLPIAGLIVALSPGFPAYEAFAAGMKSGAGISVPSVQSVSPVALPSIPTLPGSVIPQIGVQQIPGRVSLPAVVVGAQVPGAAVSNPLAPAAAVPGAIPAVPGAPATAIEAVRQAVGRIEAQPDQAGAAIEHLFTGRARAAEAGDVSGANGGGLSLPPAVVAEVIERLAADQSKPRADRSDAVKHLAKLGAKDALERVGTGTPATTADDYEVKREALTALAGLGKVVSLPAVSREHADQILKDLAGAKKPQLAVFDYDKTLEKSGSPASSQTGDALKRLAESGVETVILTNRAPLSRREGDTGMIDSIKGLSDSQKAAFTIATDRGAQVWIAGMSRRVHREEGWVSIIPMVAAGEAVASRFPGAVKVFESTDYSYTSYLPEHLTDAQVDEAVLVAKAKLAELGSNSISVTPFYRDAGRPPFLSFDRYDKSHGVTWIRKNAERLGRLRDAERMPRVIRGLARRIASLLPKGPVVPASATLLVGDHFFGLRGIDADMVKGAPGALAISVGGTADPRLENVFVWPTTGHEASMEVARAASGPAAPQLEGLDKKAALGLFTSRTLSIVAFLATTLAHNRLMMDTLQGDAAAFGTIGALGALAAIAAGPLMGRIADKLSPAKGMTINLVLRGAFMLYLPMFAVFDMLNFWTLLLGAVANGFLLSSIMTSENAYLRRLFGFKNLGTMNSLLQLNYFALQIVFGLLLGIGKWVDGHDLMIPFYVASAVHFALVPLIRWTMPHTTNAQASGTASAEADGAAAKPSKRAALAGFFKKYWKEALLLAAAAASFPFFHTALPITAALAFWITRTDGFDAIKADKSILKGVGLVALGAFMLYAMQGYMLPNIAKALAGGSFALLNGKMLGSLFLGQMVSSATLAQLPSVRLPVIGRFGLQRVIQGSVLAMAGAWVFLGLFPGSLLAAGAAVALGGAMMALASRLTDNGWLSFIGVGLGSLLLPALFWGSEAALLAGLVSFGFFLGPATVSLFSYIQRRAPSDKIGAIMGIQGSLFNAAISLGIGTVTALTGLFSPVFPPAMYAVAILGAAIGAIYFLVSRTMPGLSKDRFYKKPKEDVK